MNPLTRCAVVVFAIGTAATASGSPPLLSFPLDVAANPYTAEISAVLDHGSADFFCPPSDAVEAYTGEVGDRNRSFPLDLKNCRLYDFQNSGFVPFIVNGQYQGVASQGGNQFLSYDGHPGYDYPYQATILAPASGILRRRQAFDQINGSCNASTPWEGLHTFEIDHGDGWSTVYLHASSLTGEPAKVLTGANFWGKIRVAKDEPIAIVGSQCTTSAHLHFEVRYNDQVVDPYGWEWLPGTDPIGPNVNAEPNALPLWEGLVPSVSGVTTTPNGGAQTAVITGSGFDPAGVYVTLWNNEGRYFHAATSLLTPDSPNQVSATLPSLEFGADLDDYVLKVKNVQGPRSTAWPLQSAPGLVATRLPLVGEPAPGGGTVISIPTVGVGPEGSLNDLGEYWLSVSVDTNADGLADEERAIVWRSGSPAVATFSGGLPVGIVRSGRSGKLAFSDDVFSPSAIHAVPDHSLAPVNVVADGDLDPASGLLFAQLSSQLAVNRSGDVLFRSSLFDPGVAFFCCYLNRFTASTGLIDRIVGTGDATPVGGTFASSPFFQFGFRGTNNDVVFSAAVEGGTSSSGYFMRTSTGIQKILAVGDVLPPPLQGTVAWVAPAVSVAGDWLSVHAAVAGGASTEALLGVNLATGAVHVIAAAGDATGTRAGGQFTGFDANRPVQARPDGSAVFSAWLSGAVANDGLTATDQGLFLWDGQGFQALALSEDLVATGGRLGRLGAPAANGIGSVVYRAEVQ